MNCSLTLENVLDFIPEIPEMIAATLDTYSMNYMLSLH